MPSSRTTSVDDLPEKIARLMQERGWNQEEFARRAKVHRHTIRQIVHSQGQRRLHNQTVSRCAQALGFSVQELREWPLRQLIARLNGGASAESDRKRRFEEATQPELAVWLAANPSRAAQLTEIEMDELLSLQGTGGPLTAEGMEYFAGLIERRRKLHRQVDAIAGTEFLALLEQMIQSVYDQIQLKSASKTLD